MSPPDPTQPTPGRLRWSGMTHPGRVRTNNEDTFLALNFDAKEMRYLGKIGESTLDVVGRHPDRFAAEGEGQAGRLRQAAGDD